MTTFEGQAEAVTVYMEEGDSEELRAILIDIMPEWASLFSRKNADYGSGSSFELGVRGQFSDIYRKMIKLKRSMWDGEDLAFEDEEEIIMDMIGHLFLTLYMKRKASEVERDHAYSSMSTDDFLDKLIEEYGGPKKAITMTGILGTDLANRLATRCGALMEEERARLRGTLGSFSIEMNNPNVEAGDRIKVTGLPGVLDMQVAESPFKTSGEVHMTLHPVTKPMAQRLYEDFSNSSTPWDGLSDSDKIHWMSKANEITGYQQAFYQDLVNQARGFGSSSFADGDAEQHGL